ncbi:hypothetical protein BK120_03070 [Paenibacillus sp. FSL A5-0031]|uniref:hypothetical protein n=1 Tax=Paenibacillus sp. FSL A5-0031 TaxID=1920420 RepID=UPI00096FCEF1|nr:hypothetical protein [Paenibacillus sp. FSL A5-0031]OME88294.1 hypothetical protein BK120_03070 [Paenibacillus sp. FSL A5-0031]
MKLLKQFAEPAAPTFIQLWRHPGFLILFLTGGIIAFGNKMYELALHSSILASCSRKPAHFQLL